MYRLLPAVPLVAKTVDLHNDPTEPILTFRFWVLSTLWTIVGCSVSTFYYFKPYVSRACEREPLALERSLYSCNRTQAFIPPFFKHSIPTPADSYPLICSFHIVGTIPHQLCSAALSMGNRRSHGTLVANPTVLHFWLQMVHESWQVECERARIDCRRLLGFLLHRLWVGSVERFADIRKSIARSIDA